VKQIIDWSGAFTLVASIVCLMFGLELGGDEYMWGSVQILALFSGFLILFGGFLFIETKAKNPIISFEMFKYRLYTASNFVGLFYGATFMVATIYIPLYIQGVMGGNATSSGLLLIPMMIGTTITASLGGELVKRMSYQGVMFASVVILLVGIGLLSTLSPSTSRLEVTIYMIIIGLGTGASFSVLSMAAMHHFDSSQRGAASSTNAFLRSLGMTIGITIFGVIQQNIFSNKLSTTFISTPTQIIGDPHVLLSAEGRAKIPASILDKITEILSTSIAQTFFWSLIPAILALLFVVLMGKAKLSDGKMAQH
jgi:MFS family permease